jgi:hypothetical protein
MLKRCFHVLVLGVTVVIGANSAMAQNFQFAQGELQRLPDVAAASAAMPAQDGWIVRGQTCATMGGCDDAGTCGAAAHCDDCDDCCDDCIGNWRDNTVVFLASDAWSNIGDSVSAGNAFGSVRTQGNFGYRTGFNTGLGLGNLPFRAQVGASYGAYDFKGRSNFGTAIDSAVEQQIFFTAGLYKRGDICDGDRISWGVVYDHMYDDRWGAFTTNNVNVGQIRGIFGYALSESNEVGVWGATRAQNDQATLIFSTLPTFTVRSVDQVNAFWHHNYAFGGDSWLYVGAADSPASWTIGFSGQAPLSNRLALFGSTNYYIPGSATGSAGSTEEIWNVTVGLSFYLGGKAANSTVSGHKGLPLLNVADNGTLAIQR